MYIQRLNIGGDRVVNEIVLASESKWRKKILDDAGIPARCVSSGVDESEIISDSPKNQARLRAEAKARAVAKTCPDDVVVGCDQVLEFDEQAFGKAKDRDDARARLKAFSGQTHYLHSAIVVFKDQKQQSLVVTAKMMMKELSDDEIEAYLDTEEWVGCAGCYQYENQGGQLFSSVEGDITTIIGLPLSSLKRILQIVH